MSNKSKKNKIKSVFIPDRNLVMPPVRTIPLKNPEKEEKTLFCDYRIWISNTELGILKKRCITGLSISETVEGADYATIDIQDPEFRFLEDNIFDENNEIKIQMGWDDADYVVTFEGYISAIDIEFGSDGIPLLYLTCMDKTHKMNRKKRNATYKNKTTAAVVKRLAKKHGFRCVVDDTYKFHKQETITQSDQTDIEFITQLASDEVYPFTARLKNDTLYYEKIRVPKAEKKADMTLVYKNYPHTIVSFKPQINKEEIQVEVSGSSINTRDKKVSKSVGKVSGGVDKGGSATATGSQTGNKSSGNNGTPNTGNTNTGNGKGKADHNYVMNPENGDWDRNRV